MDISKYIGDRWPTVVKGLTNIVASRIAAVPEREDSTPRFMERKLRILENYQRELTNRPELPRLLLSKHRPRTAKVPTVPTAN